MGIDPQDAHKREDAVPREATEEAPPAGPPTIVPAFDPEKYAEEYEVRGRQPTLTDEVALEQARIASLPSLVPSAMAAMGKATVPPGPLAPHLRDSQVEIDASEQDLDALGDDEQLAILHANLAPLSRVPKLARPLSELRTVLADPQTAYVLGFVDGILPLETIVEVTGLSELDTLRILDRAVTQGVVTLAARR